MFNSQGKAETANPVQWAMAEHRLQSTGWSLKKGIFITCSVWMSADGVQDTRLQKRAPWHGEECELKDSEEQQENPPWKVSPYPRRKGRLPLEDEAQRGIGRQRPCSVPPAHDTQLPSVLSPLPTLPQTWRKNTQVQPFLQALISAKAACHIELTPHKCVSFFLLLCLL